VTSFAVTAAGNRFAYSVAGRPERSSLIFTHSLGTDRRMWHLQVQALKDQYHIVSIDNIGHGESDVPSGDYTIAEMAAGVLAVADAAELEQFHYCGLSVGGITGQYLATEYPERLLSLTLSNTAAKIGAQELWDQRSETARSQGMGALEESVMARWFSPHFAERHPEHFALARETLLATDPNGYAGVCGALRDSDLSDVVGSITTPTLVIGGKADQATPIEQARWLHEQIDTSQLVELPAAHLSNLDCETEFTAALGRFLAEQSS
jgi:3-oxoadipate enol-lactonase